ncbi:MAG TPA: hypothetical protein DDZ68_15800 [Parvularcula sp.]|jgi:hypothetical protein|nr:hypothetical protein [Parvularcula sp.]
MGCILNRCNDHVASDLLVVAYYAIFVLVAVGLSYLANSKSIRTAAGLIGVGWAFGLFSFFYLNVSGYFLVAVMYDTILAYHFWRMAKVELFAAPLYIALLFEITFIVFTQGVGLSSYATMFILNRLFEFILLYLIGCSLFRLHVLRLQRKSKEPITDWRVRFVIG